MTGAVPNPLLESLVAATAPPAERDVVVGDLRERFARHVCARGRAPARRWYLRQAATLIPVLVFRRVGTLLSAFVTTGTMRWAGRSVVRSPGSSLVAVATLGFGVMAPVAAVGLLSGLRTSLPGDPEDRVVKVDLVARETGATLPVAWEVFEGWRDAGVGAGSELSSIAAFQSDPDVSVGGGGTYATRRKGVYAMAEVFEILRVRPLLGRVYQDDELNDGVQVALIHEDLWEERFNRNPDAIGQTLRIDGVQHTVVGVFGADFGFPSDYRLWMEPRVGEDPEWSVVGRLWDDASATLASQQLNVRSMESPGDTSVSSPSTAVRVEAYTTAVWGNTDDMIEDWIRTVSVLLIGAAISVASIMLARGMARSDETVVRRALGASTGQVVAPLILEATLLVVAGVGFGLFLASTALRVVVADVANYAAYIPYWMVFEIGWPAARWAIFLAVVAIFLTGVIPAVRASKVDLQGALRASSGGGQRGSMTITKWLVGLEVMAACALLVVMGVHLEATLIGGQRGIGFDVEGVVTGRMVVEAPDYPTAESRWGVIDRVLGALREHPSIGQASITTHLPGTSGSTTRIGLRGVDLDIDAAPLAQLRVVDPGFLGMFGAEVVTGRSLANTDVPGSEVVAVVNEAFAQRRAAPSELVGSVIDVALGDGTTLEATVVGVVRDRGITPDARGSSTPGVYFPAAQQQPVAFFLVSSGTAGSNVPATWRETVASVDPRLPVAEPRTLAGALDRDGAALRRNALIAGVLGALALLLSLVGLNGVHSYLMAGRTREIGIRRAVGAASGRVMRENLARGLWPVWVGLAFGLGLGLVLVRVTLTGAADVNVSPVLSWVLSPILVVSASALAIWRPTRIASHVDPMRVLNEG